MNLSDDQFKGMHEDLKASGGFSAHAHTGAAPTAGFMVSIPGHEQNVRANKLSGERIKSFTKAQSSALAPHDRFIGGWQGTPKTVSLDVSRNVSPDPNVAAKHGDAVALADARTSAEDLAVAYNQKATYDLQTGNDIVNPEYKLPAPQSRTQRRGR